MMPCIFCQIVAKTQPANIVYEDDEVLVFTDIHPKAPIHVLLIPKPHIATVNDLEDEHIPLMGKLFTTAKRLATEWDIVAQGYRLTVNVGRGGGQIIDHLHMHLLSGWQHTSRRAL
jgi:histidine triad (HIT) family protein